MSGREAAQRHWPEIDIDAARVRLPEGPGEEYFPELKRGTEMDGEAAGALWMFRRVLSETPCPHVRPQDTTGEIDDYWEMLLTIRHAREPETEIWLDVGDGVRQLGWPRGSSWLPEHDPAQFVAASATFLRALLTGNNRQTVRTRLGRVIDVSLELFNESGSKAFELDHAPARGLLLRMSPFLRTESVIERIDFGAESPLQPA
jgi:hypothetical protein